MDYRGRTIPCGNDHQYEFIEFRDKKHLTVLGPVTVKRAYYYDRECRSGYCPKDRALDIEGTSYSSGVRRMMSRVGAYRPFGLGHEDLYELADIRVSAKEVERISQMVGDQAEAFHAAEAKASLSDKVVPIKPIPRMYVCMDGTWVPVVKKETAGRQGKGEDGQAKTREAKLGCVFTQTGFDRKGRPVRDDESTSYAGAIETAEVFGRRIYQEAMRRGMDSAGEAVVIGDGAAWIWNIANEQLNKDRMRYEDFRRRGLFIGSGVLEAGCRTVIGQRLKHSGMHWTVKGANSIIALRCNIMSNRWEDFWEHRAAA